MIHTSKFINKNFRIKVSGIDNEGNRINKLVGVSGLLNLIGETLADKFVTRALKAVLPSSRASRYFLRKIVHSITFNIQLYG